MKERLFGLSNPQGNHGESLKEAHFHLDNTPTHSYMKYLYKYPQRKFPYEQLVEENAKRSRDVPEFTLLDTGIFKYRFLFWVCVKFVTNSGLGMIGIGISSLKLLRIPTMKRSFFSVSRPGIVGPSLHLCTLSRICGSATLGLGATKMNLRSQTSSKKAR